MKKWVRNLMLLALALTLGVSLAFAEEGAGGGSDPGDGGTEVCQHNQLSDWKSDGERHWKVCEQCGIEVDVSSHTGGTATCTKKAVCTICNHEYGELAPHTGGTATCEQQAACDVCKQKYGDLAPHDYAGGKILHDANGHWYVCSVCSKNSETEPHSGGTATCKEKAVCAVCGEAYGELGAHAFTVTNHNSAEHWKECSVCGEKSKVEAHAGGKATCTAKAVCDTCGAVYGKLGDHDFSVVKSVGAYHWTECSVCGTQGAKHAHTGGTATCVKRAECSECGATYGERAAHTGGTATCTQKAICTVCGSAYGDYAPHTPAAEWTSDQNTHWHRCTVCNTKLEEAAHTENGGTVVTKPTANAAGLKAYVCTVCGRQVRTEYIPATGAASSSSAPASSSASSSSASASSSGTPESASSSSAPVSSSSAAQPDASSEARDPAQEAQGRLSPVILIIAGGLAAAAVVCGVIMVVYLRRR